MAALINGNTIIEIFEGSSYEIMPDSRSVSKDTFMLYNENSLDHRSWWIHIALMKKHIKTIGESWESVLFWREQNDRYKEFLSSIKKKKVNDGKTNNLNLFVNKCLMWLLLSLMKFTILTNQLEENFIHT